MERKKNVCVCCDYDIKLYVCVCVCVCVVIKKGLKIAIFVGSFFLVSEINYKMKKNESKIV